MCNETNRGCPKIRFLSCVCLFVFSAVMGNKSLALVGPEPITTVAGGYYGDSGSATSATFNTVADVAAIPGGGGFFIVDGYNHRVRKVDAAGVITTVAGNGVSGYGGDGGPAVSASLAFPSAVAVDAAGANLYIADQGNRRVRKVVLATGVISTFAGNGVKGFGGDGGPAAGASFSTLDDIAVDMAGNVFVADGGNHRIRKVDNTGTVTTVAGNGAAGFGGDGGAGGAASLNMPHGVAADGNGNVYIADYGNQRIRKLDANGNIATVAGNGTAGFGGDGGPASAATLAYPNVVSTDAAGNLYIADNNNRVRKVDAANGNIATIAGVGTVGFDGDGGPATAALFAYPVAVAADGVGNLLIADAGNLRIRKISAGGTLSTVAGGAAVGDGKQATAVALSNPVDVALDDGNLYIADTVNNRVRKVDVNGLISTVAGNGSQGFGGDGGPAAAAALNSPNAIAVDTAHNLYIADSGNNRIRKVDASGNISTVAGNGSQGFGGDGGTALAASFAYPDGVAVDAARNLYVADALNHRVRKVDANGIVSTVVGNGTAGFAGDGGQATAALLNSPGAISLDRAGNLLVVDTANRRIRKLGINGIISTVAGNGASGFSGDGGPATAASLVPSDVAEYSGSVYIVDNANQRIRKVDIGGTISTVAGNGSAGFGGDGGPAIAASLAYPNGVALDGWGNLYFGDTANQRVRKVGDFKPRSKPSAWKRTLGGS